MITINLPWPPSSNHYWRRNGARYFISSEGQQYRRTTNIECIPYRHYFTDADRIKISVEAYPPDKRKRDLDNLFKSILDSLQFAAVFKDDSKIDDLSIKRMPNRQAMIVIRLERIE